MATEPIQGGPYPEPGDAPDGPSQMSALASWAASRSVMRFASIAARDAALPTPVDGMLCFVAADNTYYGRSGGAWGVLWQDTGWVNVPLESGFTNTQTLQVRRIGKIVAMRGRVSGAFGPSNVQIGIVPAGFRPEATHREAVMGGGYAAGTMLIGSDGPVVLGVATSGTRVMDLFATWPVG